MDASGMLQVTIHTTLNLIIYPFILDMVGLFILEVPRETFLELLNDVWKCLVWMMWDVILLKQICILRTEAKIWPFYL